MIKEIKLKWVITNVDYNDEMLVIIFSDKIFLNTMQNLFFKTSGLTDNDV